MIKKFLKKILNCNNDSLSEEQGGVSKHRENSEDIEMKYLIVGLGNIGPEYHNTRHNIGFTILDAFAEAAGVNFEDKRYGFVTEVKVKGRTLILLKPSTFMNLSGNAVRYWMQKEKIPVERMLVLVDDFALQFGTLRLKPKGSDAGHNGLKHIQDILGHSNYNRLRFGIGNDFPRGAQVHYVLSRWNDDEEEALLERAKMAIEMIKTFALMGAQFTMNAYNNKPARPKKSKAQPPAKPEQKTEEEEK